LDPRICTLFIQSDIKEHAELYMLLGMITPLPWLERNPTYKEQKQVLHHKDLSTYGFLGYPVLQAADIILYKANGVPVGKDQLPHVELTREIARRFNFMYRREVFPIPDPLLTDVPVLPGLDGRKMSKSYNNCIYITEPEETVRDKIAGMMTDPQRVRRNDPGDPALCPVFAFHKIYSSPLEGADVSEGCRTARIGCVECKKRLVENVLARLTPVREKRLQMEGQPARVEEILRAGRDVAANEAVRTLNEVREAVGLGIPFHAAVPYGETGD
jgi:tryptophanyl-tRNA synthetase